jgi:DNA-binding CsgD family transcriptional regulator/PAS domain-containing protein
MGEEAGLLRIVERIYESTAGPPALADLAPEIAREFHSDGTLLYTVLKPGAVNKDLLSATGDFDDWAHASYTNYYREIDELSRRAVRKALPLVTIGHELLDERDFLRSEVYADYFRKIGLCHMLAGIFPIQGDLLGVVSIYRPERADDFDERDRRRLTMLVPHIQRAVQIRHRLSVSEQDRALTLEVLDRLALGAIIVDGDGRVIFANNVAEQVIRFGQGIGLSQGCIQVRGHERGARLDQAIRAAAAATGAVGLSSGGLVAVQRPGGAHLTLLVSPFRPMTLGCGPQIQTALVMFSDPDTQTHIPENILARVLGLANAEARLLAALVAGQTMQDYADAAGITMNTAKTQLRQIFLKTGHNRQTDVIRAVLADPVMKLASAQDNSPLSAA